MSIGASCAAVYLMKKRQEEKLKRMEEKRGSSTIAGGESSSGIEMMRKVGGSTVLGRISKRVHPGPQNSAGKQPDDHA
ncbi:hypothetical protein I3843_03G133900 [Carya illinoinensis]|uniref:Uncharacterized protein n=1 Tax=Carya illinoinensis TaxID=32201 RepID=A0A8T1R2H3_CARIL|nr:hypothetical protein I3760_03G131600 [Carya illinoinensis]KAG6660907.1 hypothetical protein CIPAW_03G137500 [Carya illinoinensis]KAG6721880.1 hypothetical protein I3842_03G134200 [Carya illinoinensis]KAG7987426.1 hypothetical protein I3843_03G133900 [Carya illinoinensis]